MRVDNRNFLLLLEKIKVTKAGKFKLLCKLDRSGRSWCRIEGKWNWANSLKNLYSLVVIIQQKYINIKSEFLNYRDWI